MANLKEVRTRIESVNSTKQITSAMKMVAASKLRKSQNAIMSLRPYAEKFSEMLEQTTVSGQQSTVFSEVREDGKILIIPLSSNKGLCGVFNANVIRATMNLIKEEYQEKYDNKQVDILCVGSKVEEALLGLTWSTEDIDSLKDGKTVTHKLDEDDYYTIKISVDEETKSYQVVLF